MRSGGCLSNALTPARPLHNAVLPLSGVAEVYDSSRVKEFVLQHGGKALGGETHPRMRVSACSCALHTRTKAPRYDASRCCLTLPPTAHAGIKHDIMNA